MHFLLHCGEFVGDKGRLLGMIEGIEMIYFVQIFT